jgi:hypothetical protein
VHGGREGIIRDEAVSITAQAAGSDAGDGARSVTLAISSLIAMFMTSLARLVTPCNTA